MGRGRRGYIRWGSRRPGGIGAAPPRSNLSETFKLLPYLGSPPPLCNFSVSLPPMNLLDLYCGGGGASYGYEQAGFTVTGVDNKPQPKYRGQFIQADALEYLSEFGHLYDVIHASPPCQAYSMASMQFRVSGKEYVDLIASTRDLLIASRKPYVIENVPGSPLVNPVMLCGAMFGLRTYRHRLFESSMHLEVPPHPVHVAKNTKMGRKPAGDEYIQYVGHFAGVAEVKRMTGLYWLGRDALAQSIPPQYTKYIGKQLMTYLQ